MTAYQNKSSQQEREAILRNDRANTFAGRASAELDLENSGRHAKPNTVIGVDGPPDYPRLPENSWTHDPVPPEGPLGVSVEDHEPVGENFELARSLPRDSDTSGPISAGGANTPSPNTPSGDVECPGQSKPKPNEDCDDQRTPT
jgi:hypothetical protein